MKKKNRANQRNQYSSLSLLLAMLYETNSEINCSCVDGLLSSSKHASQFRKKCACSLSWFGARYFIVRLSRNEKEGGRKKWSKWKRASRWSQIYHVFHCSFGRFVPAHDAPNHLVHFLPEFLDAHTFLFWHAIKCERALLIRNSIKMK